MAKKRPPYRPSPRKRKHIKDDSQSLLDSLPSESDRGCVLIAGEHLNNVLGIVLSSHFANTVNPCDDEVVDRLLYNGTPAPLGTANSRELCARALGLIDDTVYDALKTIRQIRNEFAHHQGAALLQTSSAQELEQLLPKLRDDIPFHHARRYEQLSDARCVFIAAVFELSMRMNVVINKLIGYID